MTSKRGRGRPKMGPANKKVALTHSVPGEYKLTYDEYCAQRGPDFDKHEFAMKWLAYGMAQEPIGVVIETMKKETEAKTEQIKAMEQKLTEQTKLIEDEAQKINTAIDRYVQLTAEKDVKDEVVLWDVDRTTKPRPNPEMSFASDHWVDPVTYSSRAKRIALLVTRDLKEAGIETPKLNIEDIKNRFRVVVTRLEAEKEANRRYIYPKKYIIDEVRVHD